MPTTTDPDVRREQRLRGRAERRGYVLRKSRVRTTNIDNYGGYMVLDANRNLVVAGPLWELDLDDVDRFLA
jgi:hypothetical protein